ncbi:MAG: RNA pseudouridine synthase [Tenericutes bacterium]|nr:RNA pseudouridine synthase [Mycoplasmatota bacterium]
MNNLNILYEDNHIIVIIKEPNVLVQSDDTKDIDLITIIKSYLKDKYNKPGNVYLGLVHRLDRPVGGVMIFAKTSKAASRLSEDFRSNKVKKTYVALVHGNTKDTDTLINYLVKDEDTNTSSNTTKELGKEAILEYKKLNYKNNMSLLEINLKTGRHHQIRVQLSNINHPIYGDQRYGIDKIGIQIHLHASSIEFIHPVKKELMKFYNYPSWYNEYIK